MDNEFRKDKLNNGCIVQLRNGDKYMYLENAEVNTKKENILINLKTGTWRGLEDYSINLKECNGYKIFDIIKICNMDYIGDNIINHIINDTDEWTAVREENKEEDLKEIMKEIKIKTEELNKIMARYERLKEVE